MLCAIQGGSNAMVKQMIMGQAARLFGVCQVIEYCDVDYIIKMIPYIYFLNTYTS